jgi:flavodoxin
VVYESMYGNTHTVADHIGAGFGDLDEVLVASVRDALELPIDTYDLLVVGGPTHAHGVSTFASRKSAQEAAEQDAQLELDPDAPGLGLRDWFKTLEGHQRFTAAFDTRIDAPAAITGRASKGIGRRLQKRHFHLLVEPESFLVDKHNHLLDGEADRATEWGRSLAAALSATMTSH